MDEFEDHPITRAIRIGATQGILIGIILGALLVLFGGWTAAHAQGIALQPPARFQHCRVNVIVQMLSPSELIRRCHSSNPRTEGCALGGRGRCTILVAPRTLTYESIVSHERGHCCGWTVAHEPF